MQKVLLKNRYEQKTAKFLEKVNSSLFLKSDSLQQKIIHEMDSN